MSGPVPAGPLLLAILGGYVLVMILVGLWAARRTRDSRDFFIAGQRLGLLVTGMATMSAAFSGFVFIGGPGLTYRMGLASLFICLPVGFTAGLLCWTVAKRLRLLAEVREVYTVPDALACRYRSRLASGLAALAVLVGSIGYLAAQVLALGIAIELLFDMPARVGEASLAVSMILGGAVVLAYSAAGGMIAGAYTDLIQGVLMVIGALGVFAYALRSGGGLGAITASIAASPRFGEAFLDPLGTVSLSTAFGFFFVFGVGTLGQPHMLHKFLMLDDPRKLRWMPLVIGGSQAACILLWLGIGLAVPALVARGELAPLLRADDATPLFLLHYVPPLLAALVFAAVLAAIMSTSDSFVNIGAAVLVRDLPRALGRTPRDELRRGRLATVALMIAAGMLAWLYGDLVALLGTFAFGTFAAALAPALAVGLNWRRVTATAASASIATGLVLNLGLELVTRSSRLEGLRPPLAPGALPAAMALAGSLAVLLLLSWWGGSEESTLEKDVETVLEA